MFLPAEVILQKFGWKTLEKWFFASEEGSSNFKANEASFHCKILNELLKRFSRNLLRSKLMKLVVPTKIQKMRP
jgi:hypothetical protein